MLKESTRIMVFGTFDFLHKGHLHFFKQARKLAKQPYLIVSVARSNNVQKIKGFKPVWGEKRRMDAIKATLLAEKVVLGAQTNYIDHIVKHKPAIIALGHDQTNYTTDLLKKLLSRGLAPRIVRLKPFKRHVYKSSLLKQKSAKK